MTITILVVDDQPIRRHGMRLILETQDDFEVIGAVNNGLDALQKAVEHKPDVVIFSLMIPKLNSLNVMRQIRAHCPATRVIMASMDTTSNFILPALRAGVNGYLAKSSTSRELIQAVRIVVSDRHYLCQEFSDGIFDRIEYQQQAGEVQYPLDRLSSREQEVFRFVVEGKTSAEIAVILVLSPDTVKTYRSRLMSKLGLDNGTQLIKFAVRHGFTSLE